MNSYHLIPLRNGMDRMKRDCIGYTTALYLAEID